MRFRFAIAAPALLSCTEYGYHPKDDGPPGGDDSSTTWDSVPDTDPPEVNACADPEQPPAHDVALNTECEVELHEGSFTPVVEFHHGNSSFCGPPAVGQIIDTNSSGGIDHDDLPVILAYQGGRVAAVWGDGSGVAWQSTSALGQDGGFAIGDVNGDGWPDVATASQNTVCALDGRNGTQLWCTAGLAAALDPYGYSYPSIADMDGDGAVEVTAGSAILAGASGVLLGQGSRGKGAAPYGGVPTSTYGALSVPVDLDGDGQLELVTGNAAYDLRGRIVWANGGLDGLVAVADFDGDGQGEIVKTSGIYLTGMESDGTEVWGPNTYQGNVSPPAIDDLDGDGTPEIVFAAQNKLIAVEWGGAVIWQATITDASGAAGPTLFDFEMDGYPEVLYADEQTIRFFSGLDGTVKYQSGEHASYTILETPVVADVDNDDQVEIVLGHCNWNKAFTVFGDADRSWPPGRRIWNQHAYYITNVDDVGGVPSPTPNNFSLYNSFRSGDIGRPPSEYWDIRAEVLDVCEDECDQGRLYVAAWPTNAGNVEIPAGTWMSLRAGPGGAIVAALQTTSAVASGTTGDMVVFEVDATAMAGHQPVVTADEDAAGLGQFYECEESNNTETWPSTVCD